MANTITNTKLSTITWATIIVGVLDAIAAIIVHKVFFNYNPLQVYQFVASGLLGDDAYSGGLATALLGLTFHFLIAFVSTYIFYLSFPKISIFRKNKILVGLLYGLIVWVVMNLLIIPLTRIPPSVFDFVTAISIVWHMFLVGLPISVLIHNYYKKQINF